MLICDSCGVRNCDSNYVQNIVVSLGATGATSPIMHRRLDMCHACATVLSGNILRLIQEDKKETPDA